MIKFNNWLVLMLFIFCAAINAKTINARFKQAYNSGSYVKPKVDELELLAKAYHSELLGKPADVLWKRLEMQRIPEAKITYFQEMETHQRGKGFFAIRESENLKPWLIQAPHSKSDRYTGEIVDLMFNEGAFKAAMWNSVSRKTQVAGELGRLKADMAHLRGTYWQTLTEVFARQYHAGRIIQIHGFSQSNRNTKAGRDSDIILSAGHHHPPEWVQAVAQCVKTSFKAKISVFPYDVSELGATTNVQNRLLQRLGFKGFLHIELSLPMRQELKKNKVLRESLVRCIR